MANHPTPRRQRRQHAISQWRAIRANMGRDLQGNGPRHGQWGFSHRDAWESIACQPQGPIEARILEYNGIRCQG